MSPVTLRTVRERYAKEMAFLDTPAPRKNLLARWIAEIDEVLANLPVLIIPRRD